MKRRLVSILLGITLSLAVAGCGADTTATQEMQTTESTEAEVEAEVEGTSHIVLSDEEITVDGNGVTTDTSNAVYVANDIVYYEEGKDFTYGEGTEKEAHSAEEAAAHTVVHITEPGMYTVSGSLSKGQIAIDLGEDAKDDPEAVVTLILDNVDITCEVAPAVIFYNVYECSSSDEEAATKDVDTSAAGANVVIADGSANTVNGSYVAKIYESVELSEDGTEVVDSKKLHKYDGAFYSRMSMNINGGQIGDGMLNINAENEGLGSELHLTINGGQIHIVSGNDGINTNEDNVSVTTVNGGYLSIVVDGSTGEGDGIDSNGWLVINDGVVSASACATSGDAGIDSDKGIHINGGTVVATGNMLDHIADSTQNYVVFTFQEKVKGGDEITLMKGEESTFLTMPNDFTYLIISNAELTEGTYTLWKGEEQLSVVEMSGGMGGAGMMPQGELPEEMEAGERPELPEGMEAGERPELPEGMESEERPELPEGMEAGERPEMPEGVEAGERPELPEGMENGEHPEMPQGGRGGNGRVQINLEDAVTEFEIKAGSNMFMVVSSQGISK